ncbi:MAG: hypothetical protein AB8I08_24095 [Sandaracinaceae bacterium]
MEGPSIIAADVDRDDGDTAGAAYALVGVGAALVVLGAVLLAIGIADADTIANAPDETRSWSDARSDLDRAYALDGFGVSSAVVGVAGVAIGVGLLTSSGSESSTATSFRLAFRGQF